MPLSSPHLSVRIAQVADKSGVDDRAKSFAAEWADAAKYQVDLKYHHAGSGPNAKKVRWAFECAIKYIIICATRLAEEGDEDFKKEISGYVKDVIVQSLIDRLSGVKVRTKRYFYTLTYFFFFLIFHPTTVKNIIILLLS